MMAAMVLVGWARASGRRGNGRFKRMRMVRSSGAVISSVARARAWPKASATHQRRMEAAASRARTGVPSWKVMPGRRVRVQRRPSSEVVKPSSIWGWARPASSMANRVSNTMRTWLRVTKALVAGSSRGEVGVGDEPEGGGGLGPDKGGAGEGGGGRGGEEGAAVHGLGSVRGWTERCKRCAAATWPRRPRRSGCGRNWPCRRRSRPGGCHRRTW